MRKISEEAEVIVRLDYATKEAHISVSAWPSMATKMEKLYGNGLDKDTENGSRRWLVPIKAISFRRKGGSLPPAQGDTSNIGTLSQSDGGLPPSESTDPVTGMFDE